MRPKGSKAELEARRRRAVAMVKGGRSVSEVAHRVGVCTRSVSRWVQMHERGGKSGLDSKPQKGSSPKLSPDDLDALGHELLKGPRAHGFPTELWTLARVAAVIERRFGIAYHPCHVWKVLRRMPGALSPDAGPTLRVGGWSAQKPESRAREQDENAVREWREKEWPRIKRGLVAEAVA